MISGLMSCSPGILLVSVILSVVPSAICYLNFDFCQMEICNCLVLVFIKFEKLQQCRADYGFHGYGEHFVYCLLIKTRDISSLPAIHDWEENMDVEKVAEFPPAPIESFHENCDFGRLLSAGKTSGVLEFRVHCKEFLDRLVFVILKNPAVSSRVARGFSFFCPEIMLEGDDRAVFRLFADLIGVLESCGLLAADETKAGIEQFNNYIVEKRRQHYRSNITASEISDVVQYLLRDFSFQARHHVCRVLKLCCLVMGSSCGVQPQVSLDLGGSKIGEEIFQDCLRLVQSYVLSPGYFPRLFFTESTLGAVRDAIASAGVFFVTPGYDVWKDVCDPGVASFVSLGRKAYGTFLLERRKSYEHHFVECNKANRLARVNSVVPASDACSSSSLGSKSSKGDGQKLCAGKKPQSSSGKSVGASMSSQKGNKEKPGKNC